MVFLTILYKIKQNVALKVLSIIFVTVPPKYAAKDRFFVAT